MHGADEAKDGQDVRLDMGRAEKKNREEADALELIASPGTCIRGGGRGGGGGGRAARGAADAVA